MSADSIARGRSSARGVLRREDDLSGIRTRRPNANVASASLKQGECDASHAPDA
jgi:hypothetical protein